MKILHINNYDKKGGAETVFNLTRQNLKEFDNYSGFIKLDNSNEIPDVKFSTWENNSRLIGIINYIFSIKNYKGLYKFLDKHEIDIVHIHGFFSSISPSILLSLKKIKKKKEIKVIQTLHDFHVICPNSSLYNFNKNELCEKCIGKNFKYYIFTDRCDRRGLFFSIIKGIRSFVANNILKHKEIIDQFITPGEFLKNKLIGDGINVEKITVIRNPIQININNTYIKKENIICYFGRFSREKNLEFLIDAFSFWKEQNKNDFMLLLIGEGEEELLLKNKSAQNKFNKEIIFKSFLPADQLWEEIKICKYFALTSKWFENAPMSILEAVSLNILPIVPDFGGMRETIEDVIHIGKLYNANNIQSWVNAISSLEYNYKQEILRLISLQKKINSVLSLDYFTKKTKDIYNK